LDDPTGARGHGISVALAPDSISAGSVTRVMNATPVQSRMMRPSRLPESNATKRVVRVPTAGIGRRQHRRGSRSAFDDQTIHVIASGAPVFGRPRWMKQQVFQRGAGLLRGARNDGERSARTSPRHCEELLRRPRPPKLEERRRKQSSLPAREPPARCISLTFSPRNRIPVPEPHRP
jgi:hypothetical protein